MNYVKSYNISLKYQRLQIYRAERISVCGKDSIPYVERISFSQVEGRDSARIVSRKIDSNQRNI